MFAQETLSSARVLGTLQQSGYQEILQKEKCSIAIGFQYPLVTNTTVTLPTNWTVSPSQSSVLDEGSSVMILIPLCIVMGLLRGFCSRAFGLKVGSSWTGIDKILETRQYN